VQYLTPPPPPPSSISPRFAPTTFMPPFPHFRVFQTDQMFPFLHERSSIFSRLGTFPSPAAKECAGVFSSSGVGYLPSLVFFRDDAADPVRSRFLAVDMSSPRAEWRMVIIEAAPLPACFLSKARRFLSIVFSLRLQEMQPSPPSSQDPFPRSTWAMSREGLRNCELTSSFPKKIPEAFPLLSF